VAYRPEFEAALRLFARASRAMENAGYAPPVLVGGGAVELYTFSQVATGDFDIVTVRQEEFDQILTGLGLSKPFGIGHTPLGWVHPELKLGFEVVSSTLLGGLAERERVRLVDLADDGAARIVAVEDMIANRMGQYASGTAPEMREQALTLFNLYPDLDVEYLERRMREESVGDFGVDDLRL
jgi:hypothetical protein